MRTLLEGGLSARVGYPLHRARATYFDRRTTVNSIPHCLVRAQMAQGRRLEELG